ncbi:MAG: hypothetical protein ACOCWI_00490, partial [Bacillota bacterium]
MALDKHLKAQTKPKTNENFVIKGDGFRLSVLTPQLLRVEVGKEFSDEATQVVWFRDIDRPKFAKREIGSYLYIETTKV